MKYLLIILSILSFLFPDVINVPAEYPSIQFGIDSSYDGDTVLVQPGIYVENINFNGHNITLGSIFIMTGDTSYIQQTIIDGNQNGSVVTFDSGEDSTAVLSGFTISNGSGTYVGNYLAGGGVFCVAVSSPTITNCSITGNHGSRWGGGMYIGQSSPHLSGIEFSNNSSTFTGGAISCINSTVTINSSNISNNYTFYSWNSTTGGGIYCMNSIINISDAYITGNWSNFSGGGVTAEESALNIIQTTINNNSSDKGGGIALCDSEIIMDEVSVTGNSAQSNGGGLYSYICFLESTGEVDISGGEVSNNIAERGGGIYALSMDQFNIANTVISQNHAEKGGGIYIADCASSLIKLSIVDNTAEISGGGIYISDQYAYLHDSILWDNTPHQIYCTTNSQASLTIGYSDIYGGIAELMVENDFEINWNSGNINEYPVFIDSQNGDYNLQIDSPCIDAGDPESPFDPDSTVTDIGAFYFDQTLGCTIIGDLNDDQIIDILDVIITINCIIDGFACTCADLDSSGYIDILDVVLMVTIILES